MSTQDRVLWHKREEALAGIEAELMHERANALGLTGEALERKIAEILVLAARVISSGDDGEQRTRALRDHRRAREQAHELKWKLIVQREALGMTEHGPVDTLYVIPPPIRR